MLPESSFAAFYPRTSRWLDKLAALTPLRFLLWLVVAYAIYTGFFTDPWKLADWMDDHQFYAWEESDRMTLLKWHQIPQWNPYWCGGTVAASAPEDPFFGPDFLLRLVYGVAHGRRLAILLLVVMGMEGMYRLCRQLDSSAIPSAFAAVLFGTCDKFVSFLHDGWVNFLGFELIPWAVWCYFRGFEDKRYRLLGGFFIAWILLSAGTYPTPFTLLTLGFLTAVLSGRAALFGERRGEWIVPWKSLLVIGLVAVLLTAVKLFPLLSFMRQFPRVFTPQEMHAPAEVFGWVYARYGTVLILALIGLAFADKAAALCFGGALFSFSLAMGDFGPASPIHLLKRLPLFGQLRFPERYYVLIVFFLCICAARALTRIEDSVPWALRRLHAAYLHWRNPRDMRPASLPEPLVWVFAALGAFLVYRLGFAEVKHMVEGIHVAPGTMYVVEAPRYYDQPFRQARGNRRDAHIYPAVNMGTMYCVAGNPLPESALLRSDLPAEEYAQDPAKASVKRVSWSPNEIVLDVDAKETALVFVNQNWDAHWKANVGQVKNWDKLLAVEVPGGKHQLTLTYRNNTMVFFGLVSLATFLGLVGLTLRGGYRFVRTELERWDRLPAFPWSEAAIEPATGAAPPAADVDATRAELLGVLADKPESEEEPSPASAPEEEPEAKIEPEPKPDSQDS